MVNFKFGFLRVAVKTGGFDGGRIEIKMEKNKKNNKRGLLEVSGYWA